MLTLDESPNKCEIFKSLLKHKQSRAVSARRLLLSSIQLIKFEEFFSARKSIWDVKHAGDAKTSTSREFSNMKIVKTFSLCVKCCVVMNAWTATLNEEL